MHQSPYSSRRSRGRGAAGAGRSARLAGSGVLTVALAAGPGLPALAAEPLTDHLFDFQCSGNPVSEGWTPVLPTTAFTEEGGFGFLEPFAANACRDRGGEGDLADRDFVLPAAGGTFVAEVPDGTYTVVIRSGDLIASSNQGFTVNGTRAAARGAGSGAIDVRTIEDVQVTDGRLTVVAEGSSIRLNAIEVLTPLAAPAVTATVAAGADAASATLSWPAVDGAASYHVYRAAAGEAATLVAEVPAGQAPAWTDTDVQLADEYSYAVAAVRASGRESQRSEPVTVEILDPAVPAPAAPTGLAAAWTDGVARVTWAAVDGAVAYDVYRSGPGRDPVRVTRTDGTVWTDPGAGTTADHVYRVAAVGVGGRSALTPGVQLDRAVELRRQAERLDRAPVAVATDDGVYVGWRLLGDDPLDLAFHVYRDGQRVTDEPVTGSTNLVDAEGDAGATYRVSALVDGVERWVTDEFGVWDQQSLDVPLDKPAGGTSPTGQAYEYRANDASVGDVDGDGELEIVLKWDPTNSQDNSRPGYTGNVYVDAYRLDGTRLWRIDLGRNIRAGAHYTQFQVFDYDGDGRSEVMMKTADGTTDGAGTVIGDPAADHRNADGYVLAGPEFLTVFDGATGAALDTVDYVPARGDVGAWGDTYGNRVDRFLAGTAYLDGEHPSAIFSRGYYTRAVIAAWDWDGENLTERWVFDSDEAGDEYEGQGNHQFSVADVDGDQKDEIVFGSLTIDDDGEVLYNTGLGHGDALHVSDFDPSRAGLEVVAAHESMSASGNRGATFRDAQTGDVLFAIPATRDTGRAAAGDIHPGYPGAEWWAVGGDAAWNSPTGELRSASGELISTSIPAANFVTWWDGDLLREIGDHEFDETTRTGVPTISEWDPEAAEEVEIYRATGTLTSNDTKGNPALQADLLGDWREELVTRTDDSTALRIATTVDPTDVRLRTLMSDSHYRLGVAGQNTAYNQPPHTSYFIGEGMTTPPVPALDYTTEAEPGEPVPVQGPDFADVGPGHPFYADIRWLADTGLSEGTTVGDQVFFLPASPMSRQAMAAFLYRYAGADYQPTGQTFPDVGPAHQFYEQIEWMAEMGYATGYEDGTFRATAPVSRQATAAFLYRLAGEPETVGGSSFTDVHPANPFAEAIAWVEASGIARGYDDGVYGITRPVTRQAMAAFLHRYDDFLFRPADAGAGAQG